MPRKERSAMPPIRDIQRSLSTVIENRRQCTRVYACAQAQLSRPPVLPQAEQSNLHQGSMSDVSSIVSAHLPHHAPNMPVFVIHNDRAICAPRSNIASQGGKGILGRIPRSRKSKSNFPDSTFIVEL